MENVLTMNHLKRVTVSVALFFAIQARANPATETYRDIIDKAYNLSLQKDRTQAVTILQSALKKEMKKSSAQRDLLTAIDQVSKVFYSDKAQQLYELGLSLRTTDPAMALSRLQEAARLEPDNMSIEVALLRQALSSGDCDGAQSKSAKRKELFAALEDLRLILAQASLCLGKLDDYALLRNAVDLKSSGYAIHWQMADSEYNLKQKSYSKALEAATSAQKQDSSFPESYYWQWRISNEAKVRSERFGQKYLSLCKVLSSRQQRQYLAEPLLCRRTADVESFLKKNNNSEL